MATVTIPIQQNISKDSGTVLLKLYKDSLIEKQENIFLVRNFLLSLSGNSINLTMFDGEIFGTLSLEANVFPGNVYVLWSWDNNTHRLLAVNEEKEEVFSKVFEEVAPIENISLDDFTEKGIKETIGDIEYRVLEKESPLLDINFKESYETIQLAVAPYFLGSFKELVIFPTDYLYEPGTLTNLLSFKKNELISFQADYTKPNHYVSRPIIETTMAPRDASPILLKDDEGYMNRQFFFDRETGQYSDTNTEEFIYRGEDEVYLSYKTTDKDYGMLLVFENGETFQLTHSTEDILLTYEKDKIRLYFNEEQKEDWYGLHYSITYQLERSYNVEYNEDSALDGLKVNLVNHKNTELTLLQEGNRFSNQFLAKEIELNPLVNSQHTGFLYIDKEAQATQAFRLNASSYYLTADGQDSADFIIEAIDEEGNNVLSPYIDVFLIDEQGRQTTELGSIRPVMNFDTLKARNTSGRCYFEYQAPLILESENPKAQRLFAVAYDRKHDIGAQFPLILRPRQDNFFGTSTLGNKENVPVEANIPFEYFARFYERRLPENHPLHLLDKNEDGVLTRNEYLLFEKEKTNKTLMQELSYALRESEVF